MDWVNIIVSVLTGLVITIPLVVKLVEYVQRSTKEKNWNNLLGLILKLMTEAETKFDNGATRKEWVIGMIEASADQINYDIDIDTLSKLIDDLCAMSKKVNINNDNNDNKDNDNNGTDVTK